MPTRITKSSARAVMENYYASLTEAEAKMTDAQRSEMAAQKLIGDANAKQVRDEARHRLMAKKSAGTDYQWMTTPDGWRAS